MIFLNLLLLIVTQACLGQPVQDGTDESVSETIHAPVHSDIFFFDGPVEVQSFTEKDTTSNEQFPDLKDDVQIDTSIYVVKEHVVSDDFMITPTFEVTVSSKEDTSSTKQVICTSGSRCDNANGSLDETFISYDKDAFSQLPENTNFLSDLTKEISGEFQSSQLKSSMELDSISQSVSEETKNIDSDVTEDNIMKSLDLENNIHVDENILTTIIDSNSAIETTISQPIDSGNTVTKAFVENEVQIDLPMDSQDVEHGKKITGDTVTELGLPIQSAGISVIVSPVKLVTTTSLTVFYHEFDTVLNTQPTQSIQTESGFDKFSEITSIIPGNDSNMVLFSSFKDSAKSSLSSNDDKHLLKSSNSVTEIENSFVDISKLDEQEKLQLSRDETKRLEHLNRKPHPSANKTSRQSLRELFNRLKNLRATKKRHYQTIWTTSPPSARVLDTVIATRHKLLGPSFGSSIQNVKETVVPCGPTVTRTVIRTLVVNEVNNNSYIYIYYS